ncbi:hypothetical protein BJX99DRAFT_227808 [Aspergillus californicus]
MSSRIDNAVVIVEQVPAPVQSPFDTDPLPAELEADAAATPNTIVQEIPPSTAPLPLDPPAEPHQTSTLAEAQPETRENETPGPEATEPGNTATDAVTTETQPTESQEAEAPGTEPTETQATESGNTAPDTVTTETQPTESQEAEAPGTEPETQAPETQTQETSAESESTENAEDNAEDNSEYAAYYAEDEDTSVPDEAEMKEIESQAEGDYSALEYNYWEKNFYPELDDPEYRPVEKSRLTWKIKGIRGTKENPNRTKIIRSPPAYVGGYWWTIKFFPRGNNVSALSVYIECSSAPPKPDSNSTLPETEFKVIRGPADTELNASTPEVDVKFPGTDDIEAWSETFKSQYPAVARANESEPASTETWRVSAQIGVIVYNPEEPRTGWMQSSCHQFNPHNLDWGWTNFHGPWASIHRRQRGQRQALLHDDTLCFDAYIRIFDDPTRSLWWHPSDCEPTWDSLSLTGYRPLGDSVINHSADVAGLATWLHISPFCKIVQSVNVLEHLTNCDVKPKPICDALQKFLWQLRKRDQSLQYVDTDTITSTLRNLHEGSNDVCEFWERLRRSLEVEFAGTPAAKELAQLFDSPSLDSVPANYQEPVNTIPKDYNSRIYVAADKVKTTSEAFSSYLGAKSGKWLLPPVLHLELGRQTLDKAARQWRLLYNRVELDEELDLSPFLLNEQSGKYVLYGYIVHRGRRTSGKFFSILRPGGPGTKWLAFDDGSDNRVECLTRKTALGPHLGIEPSQTADHKSGHDVAIAAMYVRSDVVSDYLPGPQGPWDVSDDLKEYYETGQVSQPKKADGKADDEDEDVQVEVYSLQKYDQLDSLFNTYDLMSQAKATNGVMYLSVPRSTNLIDVRKKIATWATTRTENDVSPDNVRLWQIGHIRDRFGPTLEFTRISDLTTTLDLPQNPVRYWLQVVSDEDAKLFAMKDPEAPVAINFKPEEAVVEQASSETSEIVQVPATEGGSSSNAPPDSPNEEVVETAPVTSEQPSATESINQVTETIEAATPAETIAHVERTSQNETPTDLARPVEAANTESNAAVAVDSSTAEPNTQDTTTLNQSSEELLTPANVPVESVQPEATPIPSTITTEAGVTEEASRTDPSIEVIEALHQASAEPANVESQTESTQPDDSTEHDAVIASVIAVDRQEIEEEPQQSQRSIINEESQPEQTPTTEAQVEAVNPPTDAQPEPLSTVAVDQTNTPTQVAEPAAPVEDAAPAEPAQAAESAEDAAPAPPAADAEPAEDVEPVTPPEPEVVLPVEHIYYYIQLLDIDSQCLRTVGSFFSQKEETIKPAIRKHLEWPETKDFQVWQRIDGTTIFTLSSAETFDIHVSDGNCFIVGDKLNKEKRSQLNEAGLFANPDQLVRYLWAESRNHPTGAFTGTKTLEATFTREYYSGDFLKGYFHGKGKHIADSVATYTGDFILSKRHGKGLMEYPNGDTYDGDWSENQCYGQGTSIEFKTGNKYVGGYKDGKRHGKGISYWEVADEEMDLCQICFGEEQDALFYDCGHVCACVTCARQVDICPICRKSVVSVVKIYRT